MKNVAFVRALLGIYAKKEKPKIFNIHRLIGVITLVFLIYSFH